MATLAEYIEKNITVVRTLSKAGKIPCSTMNNYRLFVYFKSLKGVKSKMDKYQFTADSNNVSVRVVQRAVKEMQGRV